MSLNTDRVESLSRTVARALPPDLSGTLAVAVSGGSDSTALLALVMDCAPTLGLEVRVVTVDHALRPTSAQEAQQVGQLAARLGLAHDILQWDAVEKSAGNLQDRARQARYRLLADWAHAQGICAVALGHTLDDQAETVLMRLAREAGVDGLAAMRSKFTVDGQCFVRPMLALTRADLRAMLVDRGWSWIDDASNDDLSFERVRMRRALATLAPLGVDATALAQVAVQMRDVQQVLDQAVLDAADRVLTQDHGDILLDQEMFAQTAPEIQRRILNGCLRWISAAPYTPRRAALARFAEAARQGRGAVLHGVRLTFGRKGLRLCREYRAVAEQRSAVDQTWDWRWRFTAPDPSPRHDHVIRALGPEGLRQCPDWRATDRPAAALHCAPSVWRGDTLISAPLAGLQNGWSVRLIDGAEGLRKSLISASDRLSH